MWAGEPGFEPEIEHPKCPVIPFHHSPIVAQPRHDCTDGQTLSSRTQAYSDASSVLRVRDSRHGYSRSGSGTGSPRGWQTPQCRASSTTTARSSSLGRARYSPTMYGRCWACSRQAPRPQKRHAPRAAFSQVQQSTPSPPRRGRSVAHCRPLAHHDSVAANLARVPSAGSEIGVRLLTCTAASGSREHLLRHRPVEQVLKVGGCQGVRFDGAGRPNCRRPWDTIQ
jgi:hypothetical protein